MIWNHLLPQRFLGLCPVCWLAIVISVLLVILLVWMLTAKKRKGRREF